LQEAEAAAMTQKQNKTGNQQIDRDTDDYDNLQPQPDMPDAQTQQQQQKLPRMLTNLARYNAPGIKDKKKCQGSGTSATTTRWQKNARQKGTGWQNRTCNIGKNSNR
jgi:hypothetical protein